MKYLGAVTGFIFATLLSSAVMAEDMTVKCGCKHAERLPLFAKDPLVNIETGLTAYLTPGMVSCNEGDEPSIANWDAFFEGEPMDTFVHADGDEYGKILVYKFDEVEHGHSTWMDLEEVTQWVYQNCPRSS